MRILVVGSGGREHALGWALARSRSILFFAPGNAGTHSLGTNIPIAADAVTDLAAFAHRESIDLTIVGPEIPLVAGIVDAFESANLPIVGPTAGASAIEGSKAFAKGLMELQGVPTAAWRVFNQSQYKEAAAYLEDHGAPVVIKASGLAAGKGAVVCDTLTEALETLSQMMQENAFGEAGEEVLIEECMVGEEASVFALTDGEDYILCTPAQDHKRIGEGDTGPNTGGMGAYAPAPVLDADRVREIQTAIIEPTLEGLASADRPFRGCLYAGVMMTEAGPKVVEFNCRFGDPEAQVVLPLLDMDVAELMLSIAERRLGNLRVALSDDAAACVVLASAGYPGSYRKGYPISGLRDAEQNALVFHAGTRRANNGHVETAGGRVLGTTGRGPTLQSALDHAYEAANTIKFEGKTMRRDIGYRGLEHLKA